MKILKYTGLSLLLLIMFVALQAFAVVPPARAAQLSLTVTNTGDNGGVNPAANAGTGTLRQAIIDANASATTAAAPHTISFNITGTGLHTINLAGQLPTINQPIVLDGLTQPGSSCGTLVPGVSATTNTPHALTVEVTSRNKTDINTLLVGAAAGGSTIRGLVINGANTISVYNLVVYSPNNTIECNYIGTAADGQTVVSRDGSGGLIYNQQASGLEVRNNLISGNGLQGIVSTDTSGTSARSSNVSIHNNLVGTDKTGMINVSNSNTSGTNGTGIYITLGNNTSIYQNVISGHTTAGVYFTHQASLAIRGNKIGTNLAGSAAIANGYGIQDGRYSTGTIVGGSTTNDRNIIAGNTGYGFVTSASGLATDTVQIAGNYFGLGADGTTAIPNQMYNVFTQSYDNAIIGGSNPGEGNVVVASASAGIAVNGGTGVQIKGNYVGITPANTLIPNASGVSINNTSDALVGGVGPNDRNIISGQNNVAAAPGLTFANTVNSSIYGNYIGVGVDGMSRKPNNYGVSLAGNNTGMKLGGSTAAERNIISGNTAINIRAVSSATWANNVISGNYIGLDKNGDVIPGAATSGIVATSLTGVRIGGTSAGERNIISGNTGSGITLLGNGGANVQVYGNVIGLKPDGTTVAANGSGILFSSVTAPTGSYKIGGASAGQGNVISGNTKGITLTSTVATSTYPIVVQGNLIGLALDGTMARGNTAMGVESSNSQYVTIGGVGTGEANTIRNNTTYGVHIHGTSSSISVRGNAIASNGKIGINLGTDEVTDNDTNLTDNDTGANGLQNFPRRTTLTKCDGTTTEVRTVLRSKPNTTFTVDFYANPSGRDPSGNGEGQVYDSSTSVTTGSTGYAIITPPTVTNLSMTATDPDGNTSEFSNERAVSITGCGVTNKTTNDPTPSMAGTVTLAGFTAGVSPTASTISIDGQDVTASIAGSTWTLADNTLITLADGTYDTALTIADPESTMAASYSKTGALTIETTQPTVSVARKAGQTNYTQTNSAWFTLTLSEDANDATLTASDINIGTTTGSISTFTKVDETHYEFEITGMTSGDTTTPSIATNAFTDTYGNTNKASTSATNTWVMYDVTAPLAFAVNVDTSGSYSIDSPRITWDTTDGESGIDHYTVSLDGGTFTTRSSPFTPTLSAASSHTVAVRAYDKAGNYSEKTVIYPPVVVITAPTTLSNSSITDTTIKIQGPIGMIITDVGISGAGSSGFVCNPTPSPTTQVTVTCSGGSIASSGTLTVTATSDSGVTTSNSQDYVIDTVSPSVTINQKSGQADPTSTDSATYRVIFSEPIDATTFTQSDVQLSGTTGTVTTFTKVDSRTWDVTVTGMTNGDTAVASLLAGAAKDPSGNATSVSTSTDNSITYDSSRPSVTINQKSGQADPTSTNSATFTIIFSEPVSGVVASGFSIAGSATATISSLTKLNSTTWEAVIGTMTDGNTVKLSLAAGQVSDDAGNTNTASTSTDNSVTYDMTAPNVTIASITTKDTTPRLHGTINDPTASVVVTVNGSNYTAVNNGDGTWTLADNTIMPALADGTYDIAVMATDAAGNAGTDSTTNEVVIDTVAPTGTVSTVSASITNSPEIHGTTNDPTASVVVTVNGSNYTAVNNGDGTWTLAQGTIDPGLNPGNYTVTVTFKDAAGNSTQQSTSFTILRSDADLPTVSPLTWIGGQPVVHGTYDSANSQNLVVALNGTTYVLGTDGRLTTEGNAWTLNLTNLVPPLPLGSYNVTVSVSTRNGAVLGDASVNELTIIAPTVTNIVTHPRAGTTLANTGTRVWIVEALAGLILITASTVAFVGYKKHRQIQ